MSISSVQRRLLKFAKQPMPAVHVLKGRWGTGKTYFWTAYVKELSKKKNLNPKYYTYVSLFGLKSASDLHYAILFNRRRSSWIHRNPILGRWGQRIRNFFRGALDIPLLARFGSIPSTLALMALRDTFICLDDFERKSADLKTEDILGLCSLVKQERNCKVLLILNRSPLEGADDFDDATEKVVDGETTFEQTPCEAFDCVYSKLDPFYSELKPVVEALSIKNIRTLIKIKHNLLELRPIIVDTEETLIKAVVVSTALFTWSYHDREGLAPPSEFIRSYGSTPFEELLDVSADPLDRLRESKSEDVRAGWKETLRKVDFQYADLLDQAIADHVSGSSVDESALKNLVSDRNKLAKEGKARKEYSAVWELYHSTLDDNEDEFCEGLVSAFTSNISVLSPVNLQSAVEILRQLDRERDADTLVDRYVAAHSENMDLLDLTRSAFRGSVSDDYICKQFAKALSFKPSTTSLRDSVVRVATANSWGRSDIDMMAAASVDEYVELFRNENSDLLHVMIKKCLALGKAQNASDEDKTITDTTTTALRSIAEKSRMNRVRFENIHSLEVRDTSGS